MKKMTPVVAIMAVFTLATCFIMIGSVSEELKAKLKITNTDIGTLMMALMLTSIVVQLTAGPLVDRFGHKPLAIVGFLVSSASVLLLAFAATFAVAVVASVFLGIGAICCNTVGNTLLPVVLFDGKEPARASNFGNAFVGLAFVLTPLAIVTLINDAGMSYPATLSVIAALIFIFAVFAVLSDYPMVPTGFKLSMAVELLRRPAVLLAALALVCYMGLEFTMNTWSKPLMTELFGGADAPNAVRNAGRALAMFGLAMAVGRFIFSTVKNLSQIGAIVIAATSAVAIVSILILSKTGSTTVAIAAILLTGLALAPMFPTIVGVTFGKFDSSLYGSIFGIIFAIGLLGGTFVPKWIGNVSVGSTVQQSLVIPAVMGAILFLISLVIGRVGKPAK